MRSDEIVKTEITLYINGESYQVEPKYSVNFICDLEEALANSSNGKDALTTVVLKELSSKYSCVPSAYELMNEPDDIYFPYIDGLLSSSNDLREAFDSIKSSASYIERFILAHRNYTDETSKIIAASLKPLLDMLLESEKMVLAGINSFASTFSSVFSEHAKSVEAMLRNLAKNLAIEGDINQLIRSYDAWGRLGWSTIPYAPPALMNSYPEKEQEADRMMMKYLSSTQMNRLFVDLVQMTIISCDLEEAIYSYKHKQYKACSLMLFSIIESIMIRSFPVKNEKGKQKIGGSLAKAISKMLKDHCSQYTNPRYIFYYYCLLSCLVTFFEYAGDFTLEEKHTINRHYVSHGMNKRKVCKKDCIQLFLVLYNLCDYVELYRRTVNRPITIS